MKVSQYFEAGPVFLIEEKEHMIREFIKQVAIYLPFSELEKLIEIGKEEPFINEDQQTKLRIKLTINIQKK